MYRRGMFSDAVGSVLRKIESDNFYAEFRKDREVEDELMKFVSNNIRIANNLVIQSEGLENPIFQDYANEIDELNRMAFCVVRYGFRVDIDVFRDPAKLTQKLEMLFEGIKREAETTGGSINTDMIYNIFDIWRGALAHSILKSENVNYDKYAREEAFKEVGVILYPRLKTLFLSVGKKYLPTEIYTDLENSINKPYVFKKEIK